MKRLSLSTSSIFHQPAGYNFRWDGHELLILENVKAVMVYFKKIASNFHEKFDESRAGILVRTEIRTQNFRIIETYLNGSTMTFD